MFRKAIVTGNYSNW